MWAGRPRRQLRVVAGHGGRPPPLPRRLVLLRSATSPRGRRSNAQRRRQDQEQCRPAVAEGRRASCGRRARRRARARGRGPLQHWRPGARSAARPRRPRSARSPRSDEEGPRGPAGVDGQRRRTAGAGRARPPRSPRARCRAEPLGQARLASAAGRRGRAGGHEQGRQGEDDDRHRAAITDARTAVPLIATSSMRPGAIGPTEPRSATRPTASRGATAAAGTARRQLPAGPSESGGARAPRAERDLGPAPFDQQPGHQQDGIAREDHELDRDEGDPAAADEDIPPTSTSVSGRVVVTATALGRQVAAQPRRSVVRPVRGHRRRRRGGRRDQQAAPSSTRFEAATPSRSASTTIRPRVVKVPPVVDPVSSGSPRDQAAAGSTSRCRR